MSAIRAGTASEVDHCIQRLIQEIGSASMPIELCHVRILRVMLAVLQTLMEIGSNDHDLFGMEKRLLSDLYSFRSLEQIEVWLKGVCGEALQGVAQTRKDLTRSQMMEAVDYIHSHYSDPDLSVKTVSSRIFMSTSYFSALFKAHTGRTFVEYVTDIRMDKAKELLKHSGMKTYEIAASTGYQDPQYFSVLFKKHTGDTPTEYRNRITAGESGDETVHPHQKHSVPHRRLLRHARSVHGAAADFYLLPVVGIGGPGDSGKLHLRAD